MYHIRPYLAGGLVLPSVIPTRSFIIIEGNSCDLKKRRYILLDCSESCWLFMFLISIGRFIIPHVENGCYIHIEEIRNDADHNLKKKLPIVKGFY